MNYIFYFHTISDDFIDLDIFDTYLKKIKKLSLTSLRFLLDKPNSNSYCYFCDDCHISTSKYLNRDGVYFPIIGRCSILDSISNKEIDINDDLIEGKILRKGHYESLRFGNNSQFINYKDIPMEKRINHTWTHSKINITKNPIIDKYESKWFTGICENFDKEKNISMINLNYSITHNEINSMTEFISNEHQDVMLCPYNIFPNRQEYIPKYINHIIGDYEMNNQKLLKRICIDDININNMLKLL